LWSREGEEEEEEEEVAEGGGGGGGLSLESGSREREEPKGGLETERYRNKSLKNKEIKYLDGRNLLNLFGFIVKKSVK